MVKLKYRFEWSLQEDWKIFIEKIICSHIILMIYFLYHFMDKKLQKKVLDFIYDSYPLSKKDCIVLTGSRAYGFAQDNSDIDILIFTNNKKQYEKLSMEKWFRKKWEDAWLEYRIDKKILLEVKIKDYSNKDIAFNPMYVYWVLGCKALTNKLSFEKIKKPAKQRWNKNYEKILMREYINFWNEFKQMDGMIKRKEKSSTINLKIQKWIVVQLLMRIGLIIQKKPYPTNKRLCHEILKTKLGNELIVIGDRIDWLKTYAQWNNLKLDLVDFCKKYIPNKNYVGAWWKFLNEFYKIKMY